MAVILQTLEEWKCGSLRAQRRAEEFLFQDEEDFTFVCEAAGVNPD